MIMVVTWFVDGSKVGLRPGRSYNQGPIPDGKLYYQRDGSVPSRKSRRLLLGILTQKEIQSNL